MLVPCFAQVVGRDSRHIDSTSFEQAVHCSLVEPLRELKRQAAVAGFDLAIASGYRSYERQLTIWNEKALGLRPLMDSDGNQIAHSSLNRYELMCAILRWSALPGASRHHWGTDVDIYDANAMTEGYRLRLDVAECQFGGIFYPMYRWLDHYLADESLFYRPYVEVSGGVSPEPWHLSYRPIAEQFESQLFRAAFVSFIEESELELKDEVLVNIDQIFQQYVSVYFS